MLSFARVFTRAVDTVGIRITKAVGAGLKRFHGVGNPGFDVGQFIGVVVGLAGGVGASGVPRRLVIAGVCFRNPSIRLSHNIALGGHQVGGLIQYLKRFTRFASGQLLDVREQRGDFQAETIRAVRFLRGGDGFGEVDNEIPIDKLHRGGVDLGGEHSERWIARGRQQPGFFGAAVSGDNQPYGGNRFARRCFDLQRNDIQAGNSQVGSRFRDADFTPDLRRFDDGSIGRGNIKNTRLVARGRRYAGNADRVPDIAAFELIPGTPLGVEPNGKTAQDDEGGGAKPNCPRPSRSARRTAAKDRGGLVLDTFSEPASHFLLPLLLLVLPTFFRRTGQGWNHGGSRELVVEMHQR